MTKVLIFKDWESMDLKYMPVMHSDIQGNHRKHLKEMVYEHLEKKVVSLGTQNECIHDKEPGEL